MSKINKVLVNNDNQQLAHRCILEFPPPPTLPPNYIKSRTNRWFSSDGGELEKCKDYDLGVRFGCC